MRVTEVRIKLVEENNERLLGFCSITLDDAFVVRDLKIIEGDRGRFVAMPSRKLTDRCPKCRAKNAYSGKFCGQCGCKLAENRAPREANGRSKVHADIAHPIHSGCREMIQASILDGYELEIDLSQKPGYKCRYDEYADDGEEGAS